MTSLGPQPGAEPGSLLQELPLQAALPSGCWEALTYKCKWGGAGTVPPVPLPTSVKEDPGWTSAISLSSAPWVQLPQDWLLLEMTPPHTVARQP